MALRSSAADSAEHIMRETVEVVINRCHAFLDWQRSHISRRTPDPELVARHRESLKWLLRLVRALLAQAEDPEYPDSAAAGELRAVLWKLSESWEAIYNPIPEAEYQNLVGKLFPGDEPRA